jgi:hypothetical protein
MGNTFRASGGEDQCAPSRGLYGKLRSSVAADLSATASERSNLVAVPDSRAECRYLQLGFPSTILVKSAVLFAQPRFGFGAHFGAADVPNCPAALAAEKWLRSFMRSYVRPCPNCPDALRSRSGMFCRTRSQGQDCSARALNRASSTALENREAAPALRRDWFLSSTAEWDLAD